MQNPRVNLAVAPRAKCGKENRRVNPFGDLENFIGLWIVWITLCITFTAKRGNLLRVATSKPVVEFSI